MLKSDEGALKSEGAAFERDKNIKATGRRSRATKRRPAATGGGGCIKAILSHQMFGFNITPEAIMSYWELDKTLSSSVIYTI